MDNLLDLDQVNYEKSYIPCPQAVDETYQGREGGNMVVPSTLKKNSFSSPSERPKDVSYHVYNGVPNGLTLLESNLPSVIRSSGEVGDISVENGNCYSHMKTLVEEPASPSIQSPANFSLSFHEGHCEVLDDYKSSEKSAKLVNDGIDSSRSHCGKEKPEEEGNNDEMFSGIFALEEGWT